MIIRTYAPIDELGLDGPPPQVHELGNAGPPTPQYLLFDLTGEDLDKFLAWERANPTDQRARRHDDENEIMGRMIAPNTRPKHTW